MATRKVEIEFLGSAKPLFDTITKVEKRLGSLIQPKPLDAKKFINPLYAELAKLEKAFEKTFKPLSASDIGKRVRTEGDTAVKETKKKLTTIEQLEEKSLERTWKSKQSALAKEAKAKGDSIAKEAKAILDAEAKKDKARQAAQAKLQSDSERTEKYLTQLRLRSLAVADRTEQQSAKTVAKVRQAAQLNSLRRTRTYYEAEAKYSHISTKQLVRDIETQTRARMQALSKARQASLQGNFKTAAAYRNRASDLGADNSMLRNLLMQRPDAKYGGAGSSVGVMGVGRNLFGQLPGIGPIISAAGPIAAATAGIYALGKGFQFLEGNARTANDANTRLAIAVTQTGASAGAQYLELARLNNEIPKLAKEWAVSTSQMKGTIATIMGISGVAGKPLLALADVAMALGPIFNKTADEMATAIAKSADPDFEDALKRYGVSFKENATLTEKLAVLQTRFADSIKAAKTATQDGLGAYDRLKNTLTDVVEKLGDDVFTQIGPKLESITPHVTALATSFSVDLVNALGDALAFIRQTQKEFQWLWGGVQSLGVGRTVKAKPVLSDSLISQAGYKTLGAGLTGDALTPYGTFREANPVEIKPKGGQNPPKSGGKGTDPEAEAKRQREAERQHMIDHYKIIAEKEAARAKEFEEAYEKEKSDRETANAQELLELKHKYDLGIIPTVKEYNEQEIALKTKQHTELYQLQFDWQKDTADPERSQRAAQREYEIAEHGRKVSEAKTRWDNLQAAQKNTLELMQEDTRIHADATRQLLSPLEQAFMSVGQSINDGLFGPLEEHLAKSKNMFEQFVGSVIVGFGRMATEMLAKAAIFGILNAITGGTFSLAQGGLSGFLGLTGLTKKAKGGPIHGKGTGTSDSIPAMLSDGEHVLTAKEVENAGGHGAIESLRKGLRGYKDGGAVSRRQWIQDSLSLAARGKEVSWMQGGRKVVASKQMLDGWYAELMSGNVQSSGSVTSLRNRFPGSRGHGTEGERVSGRMALPAIDQMLQGRDAREIQDSFANNLYSEADVRSSLSRKIRGATSNSKKQSSYVHGLGIGLGFTPAGVPGALGGFAMDNYLTSEAGLTLDRTGAGISGIENALGFNLSGSREQIASGKTELSRQRGYNAGHAAFSLGGAGLLKIPKVHHAIKAGGARMPGAFTQSLATNTLHGGAHYGAEKGLDALTSETGTSGQLASMFGFPTGNSGTGVSPSGQLLPLDSLRSQADEAKGIIESGFFNPLAEKSEEGTAKVGEIGPGLVGGITDAVKGLKSGDTGKTFMGIAGMALSFIPGVGPIAGGILSGIGSIFGFRNGGGISGSHIARGIPAFANGGGVLGPGTGTSDSILAKVSKGEYINDAATVRKAGGFGAMDAIRNSINSSVANSAVQAQQASTQVNVNVDMAPVVARLASLESAIKAQRLVVPVQDMAEGLERYNERGGM